MRRLLRAGAISLLTTALAVGTASAAQTKEPTKDPARDPANHHLKLEIVPVADPVGPWRLRIENAGPSPVRLIADARLVTMDVTATAEEEAAAHPSAPDTAPGTKTKKKAHAKAPRAVVAHCRLPAEMRPVDEDDARALVVPPGRAYVETFDVRAMCFGAQLDAMVPGARVTPHFGWTAKSAKKLHAKAGAAVAFSGPEVIGPVDVAVPGAPAVDPVAELDAPEVILARPPTLDGVPAHPNEPPEDRNGDGLVDDHPMYDQHHHLVLTLPKYVDHESRVDIPAPLTLSNQGDRPRAIFYRASRVRFEVLSPAGERSTCGSPPDQTPLPEFYTHLKHGQAAHLSMLVSDVCDVDVFSRAGVYEVVAHVDDSGLSGANQDLSAFAGVLSSKPMLVRVRRESRHYEVPRPRLE
jgi:hypothetical protein